MALQPSILLSTCCTSSGIVCNDWFGSASECVDAFTGVFFVVSVEVFVDIVIVIVSVVKTLTVHEVSGVVAEGAEHQLDMMKDFIYG